MAQPFFIYLLKKSKFFSIMSTQNLGKSPFVKRFYGPHSANQKRKHLVGQKKFLNLVQNYMNGWKQNDLAIIISCLAPNCTVIESHGPTYQGLSDIEQWVEYWIAAKSKIKKWDITHFYVCSPKNTAFVEWDFSCVSQGRDYSFPGMSIYKIAKQKIKFIQEYRMTRPAYLWESKELTSE